MKFYTHLTKFIIIPYLGVVLFVYVVQRDMLYFPSQDIQPIAAYGLPEKLQDITFTAADGVRLQAWYAPPEQGKDSVVFFHGNAGNLANRKHKYQEILSRGYGLMALDYRGYGKSQGTPNEEGLYQDARAAIAFLQAENIPTKKMILYGESLGTGVATQMGLEHEVKLLALEAPYSSIAAVAQATYWFLPVTLLLKDRYDSAQKIGHIDDPLILFHGTADRVIPIGFGRELFSHAKEPKQAYYFKGLGHNNHNIKTNLDLIENFIQSGFSISSLPAAGD